MLCKLPPTPPLRVGHLLTSPFSFCYKYSNTPLLLGFKHQPKPCLLPLLSEFLPPPFLSSWPFQTEFPSPQLNYNRSWWIKRNTMKTLNSSVVMVVRSSLVNLMASYVTSPVSLVFSPSIAQFLSLVRYLLCFVYFSLWSIVL